MIKHLYAEPFSTHLKKAGYHEYTSAYAITLSAAQTLLKLQTPISFIADNLLGWDVADQTGIDAALQQLDGTANKGRKVVIRSPMFLMKAESNSTTGVKSVISLFPLK